MSDHDRRSDVSPDGWVSIEEAIRSAGHYVVPSDNLRPRTLEAARELSDDRKGTRKLRRFAVALIFGSMLSVPVIERLTTWQERSLSPSAAELEHQALDFSDNQNVGPHWGLYEAFSQLRRDQAARLVQPSISTSVQ